MDTHTKPSDAALNDLETLHTRSIDVKMGHEKMVEKAEPEFRPVAERFRDLHDQHATRLATLLKAHGRTPDTDGSFMGSINRGVIATRAMFDEIDEDVMDQVRNGEENMLDYFDKVLEHPLPLIEREQIVAMRGEVTALLDETRHLD